MVKNHTAITTFILLGLTDDPQLQILLFIFLFLTCLLSVTGNLTIITLVDSHLKTYMYFFLRNFSFLEVSFTTVCIPRFLYSISVGDNTISYNACTSQIFLLFCWEQQNFFCWQPCAMTTMWPSVNPCITWPSWTIESTLLCPQLLGFRFDDHCSTPSLGLQLEFHDPNAINHIRCNAGPPPKDLVLRYMGNRTNDYPCGCICPDYHPSVCIPVLHIHH